MKEEDNIIKILEEAQQALQTNNSLKLKHLSDQTIHSASIHQEPKYLIIATLVYALSKIIERKKYMEIKRWDSFVKKINSTLSFAVLASKKSLDDKFLNYLEQARKNLENLSINLKPMIQQVLRKASINKASKIYEHGVSLGKTAKLLGVTQWELSEYVGQKTGKETKYNRTINVKLRAKMAMEFFR